MSRARERLELAGRASDSGAGAVALPPALAALVGRWRQDAVTLRDRGAPAQAEALERCAVELETAATEAALELLDLERAARESGYSKAHLRRLFPGQRRIPRAALPHKAGTCPAPNRVP